MSLPARAQLTPGTQINRLCVSINSFIPYSPNNAAAAKAVCGSPEAIATTAAGGNDSMSALNALLNAMKADYVAVLKGPDTGTLMTPPSGPGPSGVAPPP